MTTKLWLVVKVWPTGKEEILAAFFSEATARRTLGEWAGRKNEDTPNIEAPPLTLRWVKVLDEPPTPPS